MQCNDTLWQTQEDGGDPTRDETLRLHLVACPFCRQRLDALQDAVHLLKTGPREAPAPGFVDRVMYRIALERSGAAIQAPSRQVAIMSLAIVTAALLALGFVWASSEAVMTLRPGGALVAGLASLVAGFASIVVRAAAVVRAVLTAARALPPEVLQVIQYSLQLCCVLAFVTVVWLGGRGHGQSRAGNSLG